jgi:hypothetical protein
MIQVSLHLKVSNATDRDKGVTLVRDTRLACVPPIDSTIVLPDSKSSYVVRALSLTAGYNSVTVVLAPDHSNFKTKDRPKHFDEKVAKYRANDWELLR